MNETFCTDVSDCSAFECDTFVCWDGLNLRPNITQEWSIVLYIIFRISERIIFAYLGQVNRELLQLTKEERREASTCCCILSIKRCGVQSKLPSGIYKQAWLRFFGTFVGVLSFILILERNFWMFVGLILIDSVGVGVISWFQHKDAPTTHSELIRMDIPQDISTRNIDKEWLANMRKFLAEPADEVTNGSQDTADKRPSLRPVLKFL